MLPVLIEGVSEETDLLLEGRWMGQAPEIDGKVYVNRGEAAPGQVVPVLVEQVRCSGPPGGAEEAGADLYSNAWVGLDIADVRRLAAVLGHEPEGVAC